MYLCILHILFFVFLHACRSCIFLLHLTLPLLYVRGALDEQDITEEVFPVDVELLDADSLTPVEGAVPIGTLLVLQLTLRGGNGECEAE